jgi:hypothetical protein
MLTGYSNEEIGIGKQAMKSATNVAENRKTLFVRWNLNLKNS